MKKTLLNLLAFTMLGVSTYAQSYIQSNANASIPDNSAIGVHDTINITNTGSLSELDFYTNISHTWVGDLLVILTSPSGTNSILINRIGIPASTFGCSSNNVDITLSDTFALDVESACPAIGNFKPENPLSVFEGESVTGNWVLSVYDFVNGDTGTLVMWSLTYRTATYTPKIIYVNHAATGNNDGTSWTDAYTKLVDATNNDSVNAQIWVAKGTYTSSDSNRTTSFNLNGKIKLYGGFDGTETLLTERDWITNETILSGDLKNNDNGILDYNEATRQDNAYHVLVVLGSNTTIDGLTISGGHANLTSNYFNEKGGAVFKSNGVNNFVMRNCTVKSNTALTYGAVWIYNNINMKSSTIIESSIVKNNLSRFGSAIAIEKLNDSGYDEVIISNNLITNNWAEDIDGNTGLCGSAIFVDTRTGTSTDVKIVNNTITNNYDAGTHLVMVGRTYSPVVIRKWSASAYYSALFQNNVFYGNTGSAPFKNVGVMNGFSMPDTTIMINNSMPDSASTYGLNATVTSEFYFDSTVFADYNNADFSLLANSQAINKGSLAGVSQYLPTTDLAGNTRIEGVIDLGCYEYNEPFIDNVSEKFVSEINIYPNPATTILNVSITDAKINEITIMDLTGKVVINKTTNASEISIAELKSGIYFIQVQTDKGVLSSKVIKK